MAVNNDIALSGGDLFFQNGDFVIAVNDQQHIADTLNAFKGWWKENPSDGVGVFQFLHSGGNEQAIRRSVMLNLQSDGYDSVNPIVTTDPHGQMIINPNVEV